MKWQAGLVCLVALVAGGARGQEVAADLPDMPEPKVETVCATVSVPAPPHDDIHRGGYVCLLRGLQSADQATDK